MRRLATSLVGGFLLTAGGNTGAMAQTYYDDQACRHYADTQTAPLRGQANAQTFGSALLGAGLGAASGAIVGTGVGVANAQNAAGYLQQQYNAYYAQCMTTRTSLPPPYTAPAPSYAPAQGYPPAPAYAPQPSYQSGGGTANDLNRQELNRFYGPPAYTSPPRYYGATSVEWLKRDGCADLRRRDYRRLDRLFPELPRHQGGGHRTHRPRLRGVREIGRFSCPGLV